MSASRVDPALPWAQSERVCEDDNPGAQARRLRTLIETRSDDVARFLFRMGLPQCDVEDATQKVFIAIARRLSEIAVGQERPYLFGVATKVVLHELRTSFRRERAKAAYAEILRSGSVIGRATDEAEVRQMLRHVLEQLPYRLRLVFVLYELEEFGIAEIARALGLPQGTVSSRLRRSRERFKKIVTALELEGTNG